MELVTFTGSKIEDINTYLKYLINLGFYIYKENKTQNRYYFTKGATFGNRRFWIEFKLVGNNLQIKFEDITIYFSEILPELEREIYHTIECAARDMNIENGHKTQEELDREEQLSAIDKNKAEIPKMIEKYFTLYEKKIISKKEFETKKKELLEKI